MQVEYNMYASLLKDAIVSLSLSDKDQVALSISGCLPCHLLKVPFFTYRDFRQYSHEEIDEKSLSALDDIIFFMHEMKDSDHICFDNDCLKSQNWEELRHLSKVARLHLNW